MRLASTALTVLLALLLLQCSHLATATTSHDDSSYPPFTPESDQDRLSAQLAFSMQTSDANSLAANSYIVEIETPTVAGSSGSVEKAISDAVDKLIENVKQAHPEAEVKHVYKSDLFTGASFRVGDETTKSHLQRIQDVKNVSPVRLMHHQGGASAGAKTTTF
ncbi:BZ3500_MvSof-1268-A1-R1_Chr2-2g04944 [Microbotryum saponariae]|uniref:BZ3500_MvSof-1268-A1-R1_Chr2-2g04944 protein n=1 Tax=Microbotryum saponariae TaxID=289078 RepID=A0A2X0LN70_9BASI|nr:BZ3500_MvSof-1268-A1-R1_Chr2-2g04944 [Microbotryum saponariae]SDA00533.1 BZ3501_MvSof-1269-A2-R1_Chr2-2g04618 [Microbotryum saponariae]